MTREEAKRFLVEHCNPRYPDGDKSQWDEAINLAISALEQSVDVQTDTISRKAAIEAVISLCDDCDSSYCGSCRVNYPGEKDARKVLEDLPSAQRKGKWIQKNKNLAPFNTIWWFECSECGKHAYYDILSEYCPCCGAEMKGEEDG